MSPYISTVLSVVRGSTPRNALRWGLQWLVVLVLLGSLFLSPAQTAQAITYPTFSIVSVNPNQTVTIQTYNFPAGDIFTVRMGEYGTLGIGGIVVAQTNSGAGGSFQETYTIPDALKGRQIIAIRMDGASGYYAYNFFYNASGTVVTPGPTTIPSTGYYGIPTFSVQNVNQDVDVTILTYNFPANQLFTVRMGAYGTLGVGGIVVATTNSGAGGAFNATYAIPDALKGSQRIAIRLESPQGYFAYNWFWNNTSSGVVTPGPTVIPPTGYYGYPTFSVLSVAADSSVTIQGYNFPPNQIFTVRMGPFGTAGIGGIVVATTDSAAGGSFQATYNIPDALKGSQRIAIRMDSPLGYFAYNWFWNNTSGGPVVTPGPTVIPPTGYTGIPTFSISSVAANNTVTIQGYNFPPNQTFTVRMGPFGTAGIGGIVVATTDSAAGGSFSATYAIPDALKGSQRIAVRMDSPLGYFAYNWFWNNTYP